MYETVHEIEHSNELVKPTCSPSYFRPCSCLQHSRVGHCLRVSRTVLYLVRHFIMVIITHAHGIVSIFLVQCELGVTRGVTCVSYVFRVDSYYGRLTGHLW